MSKFHVTKSGRTEPCGATVRDCPLGEANHYGTMEEAARAIVLQEISNDDAATTPQAPADHSGGKTVMVHFISGNGRPYCGSRGKNLEKTQEVGQTTCRTCLKTIEVHPPKA